MSKHKWDKPAVDELFKLPLLELLYKAHTVHKENFSNDEMELCTLLSIKTGTCPEDCAYCPQSGHYNTGLQKEKLLDKNLILAKARLAKEKGAKRFCMGAAWRNPPKKEFPQVLDIIKAVKAEGLETCVTLGMLDEDQAKQLKDAGLDYYNHNLDTSPEYYEKIITTRTYDDRMETLKNVSEADINVCCGGIIGMGETHEDRLGLLVQLANLPYPLKSVPINKLIPIGGTPLEHTKPIDNFDFIRTIAVARILMPSSMVRLSAGRENMSEEMQALCFMAGANSIFYGETLLTAKNPGTDADMQLLAKMGMTTNSNAMEEATC